MRKFYSLFIFSMLATGLFAQVPTSGLIGQWTFTNGSLYDFYTATNAVAQPGAVTTTDRFGNAGNAYDLPPAAYLTFGDVFDVQTGGSNSFSFSFWVKFDQINNTYRYMLGKAAFESICGLAGRQYAFLINASNQVEATLFGALTGGHVRYVTNGTVSANQWTHIVYAVNGQQLASSNLAGIKIYINGVAQTVSISETVGAGFGNGMDNGAAHLSAARYAGSGGAQCGTTQYLDGQFDDLRVYNRMITAQEVLDLYNETVCNQAVISVQPLTTVAFCNGGSETLSIGLEDANTSVVWQVYNGSSWSYLTNQTDTFYTVTQAGEYRVETQSDCGAYGYSETVTVAVDEPAFVSDHEGTVYLCPATGYAELNALAVGEGLTYQWSSNTSGQPIGNQTPISGANEETYQATATDLAYTVTVTACGNSITSDYIQVYQGIQPSISISGPTSVCAGATVNLSSLYSLGGGVTYAWTPNGATTFNNSDTPTEETTYTVLATSWMGCTATASHTVSVNDPQPMINENGGVLELSGGNFVNIQWYLDGNLINGSNQLTYTPTADGDYTAAVSENGCNSTSDPYAYTGVPTGIEDASANGLKVYPNPFNSEFIIGTTELTSISVMNAMGEVVLSRTVNGRTSIEATDLSAGIYFVREETSGAVMKLVKN